MAALPKPAAREGPAAVVPLIITLVPVAIAGDVAVVTDGSGDGWSAGRARPNVAGRTGGRRGATTVLAARVLTHPRDANGKDRFASLVRVPKGTGIAVKEISYTGLVDHSTAC